MPKDRLHEFQREAGFNDEFEVTITTPLRPDIGAGDNDTPFKEEIDYFFKQITELRHDLDLLTQKILEIKRLHTIIITSPHNNSKLRDALNQQMNDIKKLTLSTREQLKKIEIKIKQDEETNNQLEKESKRKIHWSDLKIRKTQHTTNMQRFKEIMTDYNECQLQYREQCKKRFQRSLQIAGREMADAEIDEAIESNNNQVFIEQFLVNSTQAKAQLQEIEERKNDLQRLEESIRELRDLFVEVALLVEQQGEIIDRIEYNVEKSMDFVESAVKQTQEAVKIKKKTNKMKLYIGLCVGIVLLIIIISIVASLVPHR